MAKVCSKCGTEKEESEFRKDKYRKDGLTGQCKYCIDNKYTKVCEYCGETFTCGQKNRNVVQKNVWEKSMKKKLNLIVIIAEKSHR